MRIKVNRLLLLVGLGVAGLMLASSGFGLMSVALLLGLTYLLLRFATTPLSLFIARIGCSIRWKFEIAIAGIAALLLAVGLISFGAMDFMHQGLHEIQELGSAQPLEALRAVDELEDTQHGPLFTLMPVFSVLGVIVAATLGAAMAQSVIGPVRRMEETMHSLASGDFSQSVRVDNRDELGELAVQINRTAAELVRLQEGSNLKAQI
jgi:HAMP domain-containing protein